MAPVHEDAGDRARIEHAGGIPERSGKEVGELFLGHLPGRLGELPVAASRPADMTVDADIVGRVREQHLRPLTVEQTAQVIL